MSQIRRWRSRNETAGYWLQRRW